MGLFWGDLHNHNEMGYGMGSIERSYAIASASLDFYSFTPHSWWPDLPSEVPSIRDYHLAGFQKVRNEWNRIRDLANSAYAPGKFVSFVAFEWHSLQWGDYCVHFPGSNGEVCYANSAAELKQYVRGNRAIMIPHHCAYGQGLRGTNWNEVDASLSPVSEIYSEHGNSLEAVSHLGLYHHTMGGSVTSQSVGAQLERRRVLGFVAGTDNHFGHPGAYNEGLTGVYAEDLNRDSILHAIRSRHTFAVTGDRIVVDFRLGKARMGDLVPVRTKRIGSFHVSACAEIDSISVLKNGRLLSDHTPKFKTVPSRIHAKGRIEFGWDQLNSTETTEWTITLALSDGSIRMPEGGFVSGKGTTAEIPRVEMESGAIRITAVSTRSNSLPVQTVTFAVAAPDYVRLSAVVEAKRAGSRYHITRKVPVVELWNDDLLITLSEAINLPKVKLHKLVSNDRLMLDGEWLDQEPGEDDYYYLRVRQQNGHTAWSSPIWCSTRMASE